MMKEEHIKKIAELLKEVSAELERLCDAKEPAVEEATEELKVILPVEEAFIETAAEANEPDVEPREWTKEEARDLVSKAIKSGYRKEAKAIVTKYGESVTWIAENAPGNLNSLCDEVYLLLGEENA